MDIKDIVDSQSSDAPLDLDSDADSIRLELDQDPELKKEVLADFNKESSNDSLAKLSKRIQKQSKKEAKLAAAIVSENNEAMTEINQSMIAEDEELEKAELAAAETEDQKELRAALPINEDGSIDIIDLQACIEALMFLSDKPISRAKLKEMLELPELENDIFDQAIAGLQARFNDAGHGIELLEIAHGYQLRTKAAKAPLLRKLAKVQVQRLSRGAMETLSIIAYKQPCLKDDIDQVRGVDSSHFVRTLLDRGLVEMLGRSDQVGRPIMYGTTDKFLEVFALKDTTALPPLRELEEMVPGSEAFSEELDPQVRKMRTLVSQMNVEADSNQIELHEEDEKLLAEIRERVKSIEISTPFLEAQKAEEQPVEKTTLF
jgi:segregation and condensation protein B